jgi:hypothetical protein
VLPDYLDVTVHGAPSLHVRSQEVGMKESGFGGVGGGVCVGSEDRTTRIPIGGSDHWAWGDRPAGLYEGAITVTQHPRTASDRGPAAVRRPSSDWPAPPEAFVPVHIVSKDAPVSGPERLPPANPTQ